MRLRRIYSKQLAGIIIIVLILIIGSGIVFHTHHLQKTTTQLFKQDLLRLNTAQKLEVSLFRMRDMALKYSIDGNAQWISQMVQYKNECLKWINKAKNLAIEPEENQIISEIEKLFFKFEKFLWEVTNQPDRSKLLLQAKGQQLFDAIYVNCERLVALNEGAILNIEQKMGYSNQIIRGTMYVMGLGGLILGVVLGLIISKSVVKPIYELVLKVRGSSNGELIERWHVGRNTNLADLDHHVLELINRINATTSDIEKNRKLLAQAEKLAAFGRAAAGVAHEIRNPLTAIKMLIYSMREELSENNGEKAQDLEVIIKEIDRMERFVHNFLQFARPPDPQFVAVDLKQLIHETIKLLEPRLRKTGIELNEDYDPNLDLIYADSDQMKQVIMNLILNAMDSMPKGGKLTIKTNVYSQNTHDGQRDWVQIKIIDTGCGIPEELKDTLFDPFVSGREEGIGLGLSIAFQILHRHGGWIEADNNPHGGATFTVKLPLRREEIYV